MSLFGVDTIQPMSAVRDLRILLDSELSMKQHVAKRQPAASFCCIGNANFVENLAKVQQTYPGPAYNQNG